MAATLLKQYSKTEPIVFLAETLYFRSLYLVGCGGLLLCLGCFRLLAQKHHGPWCSVLLILPAITLCALSAAPLFTDLLPASDDFQTVMVCALVGGQACLAAASLLIQRKEKDVSSWMIRHFDASLLCVLLPALVSQLLLLGEESEWAQMVCLTADTHVEPFSQRLLRQVLPFPLRPQFPRK